MSNSRRKARFIRSQVGSSMAEVLVTIGIVTGLMGVGVLSLNRGYMNLTVAKQGLVNDLRRARMQATLKGAHFLFEASGSTYTITRLTDSDADGTWEEDPDHPAKVVDLPPGFSLSASASGAAAIAEFDGRGLLVPQADGSLGIITLIVSDDLGKSHQLQIWPSGQVEEAIQQPYQS